MKRNIFLFFISFLTFFLINTKIIFSANEKACNNVFNVFLNNNREFWEINSSAKWKYIGDESSLIKEEPKTIIHGTKICSITKFGIRNYAAVQICEDGTLKTISFPGFNSICPDRTPLCQINNGQAECVDVGNVCKSPYSPVEFYYNNGKNGPVNYDGENFTSGEKICIIDGEKQIVKTCNAVTGKWDKNKVCPPNTSCVNIKEYAQNGFMYATDCVTGCSDPPGQNKDAICGENNNSVMECNGMVWTKKTLKEHFGKDCYACETLSDNSVHCQESASSLDGKCYKINKDSNIIKVLPGVKDGLMCDGTILYKCDTQIESGFYDKVTDCSEREDKLKFCGNSIDDKTMRCVDEEDFRSMIKITTTSNEEFWCPGGYTEIRTAIGCIPITVNGLVDKLLPTIFGIAGGIAFLMMVYGFIMVSTSSGDEKKVQEAQKIITSAITGLLVSVFALFLYRLIAVDILHIPGF